MIDRHVDWNEVEQLCRDLAGLIRENPHPVERIVGIANGGVIPATLVAEYLEIKDLRIVQAESYLGLNLRRGDGVKLDMLGLENAPELEVLIIDDLVDSGDTLRAVKAQLPTANSAVLFAKTESINVPDLFITHIPQQQWVNFPWEE